VSQRPFRDALSSPGFTVRTKPLREFGKRTAEQRQFGRANPLSRFLAEI